ncbi:hypothetical protein AMJ44_12465 [candidate division WOR-1 bacterium DG_54_3]|uniref:Uncharacterized protein n=1 Tax=candidate division WOR-1 bacterium DG_54_3 TaxID=1703775 RepID=A0A0S7XQX8_UNCSA|nr:MAG: hypothetical protein AMJ44_12465 [candidate division WOR-1 bacterium DG_54_3]
MSEIHGAKAKAEKLVLPQVKVPTKIRIGRQRIKNLQESKEAAAKGIPSKTYPATREGIAQALKDLNLQKRLSHVPTQGVSGKMKIEFTIEPKYDINQERFVGVLTEVTCHPGTLTTTGELGFKELSDMIAAALGGLNIVFPKGAKKLPDSITGIKPLTFKMPTKKKGIKGHVSWKRV